MTSLRHTFIAALAVICLAVPAFAQTGAAPAVAPEAKAAAPSAGSAAPSAEAQLTPEQEKQIKEYMTALVKGPAEVKLRDVATIKVPEGMVFVPERQAVAILESMGNHGGPSVLGVVAPADEKAGWFVVVDYNDDGFIEDAEGSKFNADEILQGMKEGVKFDNEERLKRGYPAMEVVGWIQSPAYDKAKRQLVWSVAVRDLTPDGKPAAPDSENAVNYNTFTLGRAGHISLNLVSSQGNIEKDKQVAVTLLSNLNFMQGRRYEDFDPKTDKVAEYGLLALVGGVAAKKLGLFAGLAALAIKFWKVALIFALGIPVALKKFFSRKPAA